MELPIRMHFLPKYLALKSDACIASGVSNTSWQRVLFILHYFNVVIMVDTIWATTCLGRPSYQLPLNPNTNSKLQAHSDPTSITLIGGAGIATTSAPEFWDVDRNTFQRQNLKPDLPPTWAAWILTNSCVKEIRVDVLYPTGKETSDGKTVRFRLFVPKTRKSWDPTNRLRGPQV